MRGLESLSGQLPRTKSCAGNVTATNSELSDLIATVLSWASCRQRCDVDIVKCCRCTHPQLAGAVGLNGIDFCCSEYLIKLVSRRSPTSWGQFIPYVDAILAGAEALFKMGSSGPYDAAGYRLSVWLCASSVTAVAIHGSCRSTVPKRPTRNIRAR